MKFTPVVLLLLFAVQLPSVQGIFFCRILGFLGKRSSSRIGKILNNNVAGTESSTGIPAPYTAFRLDRFDDPVFDGCTVTLGADFTFVGTISPGGDEPGSAEIVGTLDIRSFLFGGFKTCVEGLEVTKLDFDSPPGTGMEDYARDYINSRFDDPECFDD
jgi:hypothetical protein